MKIREESVSVARHLRCLNHHAKFSDLDAPFRLACDIVLRGPQACFDANLRVDVGSQIDGDEENPVDDVANFESDLGFDFHFCSHDYGFWLVFFLDCDFDHGGDHFWKVVMIF